MLKLHSEISGRSGGNIGKIGIINYSFLIKIHSKKEEKKMWILAQILFENILREKGKEKGIKGEGDMDPCSDSFKNILQHGKREKKENMKNNNNNKTKI